MNTVRLYPVVTIGYMANNILPMRLGELVRSYCLGEREGIYQAAALMTALVERVFDALTHLLFIALVAPFVSVDKTVEWSCAVLVGLSIGAIPGKTIVSAVSARGRGGAQPWRDYPGSQ